MTPCQPHTFVAELEHESIRQVPDADRSGGGQRRRRKAVGMPSVNINVAAARRAIQYHRIGFAQQLTFNDEADDTLHLIRASGRGMRAQIPVGWIAVLIPFSGQLELECQDGGWSLPRGRALLWREAPLNCVVPTQSLWLSLCGPVSTWARHMPHFRHGPAPQLFPGEITGTRDLRRLLVRMARIAERPPREREAMATLAEAFCYALIGCQDDLHKRVERCRGRTVRRRQQNLLRLLRVRLLIQNHYHVKLDLERLARAASYSPCHLIRAYREAFDETPSEYAARLRSDRAWALVRQTNTPICEIGELLGFESQTAFCRAFKHIHGVTTTQARRMDGTAIKRIPAPSPKPVRAIA